MNRIHRMVRGVGAMWLLSVACAALAETAPSSETVLLEDDFSTYASGPVFDVVGAEMEYQYLPVAAPTGPWIVSTFKSDPASQRGWRVVRDEQGSRMAQMYANKAKDYHMVLSAGDRMWTDYTVSVRFAPGERLGWTGAAVRCQNDRCFYFAGLEGDSFVLNAVHHGAAFRKLNVTRLAEAPLEDAYGRELRMTVKVSGPRIRAEVEGGPSLEAEDQAFAGGGIALVADGSAAFSLVRVTTDADTARAIGETIGARAREEETLQSGNPKMSLWRQFAVKEYGTGRNARFGDLDGDGQTDMLFGQMTHNGPKDRASELSCLTAVTLEGKVLWQTGKPDVWKTRLTNDVAFQIHDLDGDGRNEAVYCMNRELVVADGATGAVRRRIPTPPIPPNTPEPYNETPQLLGDSLLFCDLRGTGRPADMIVKDRYTNYWAYSDTLELLWQGQCVTGHYPFAADVDGDGRDEVALGYSLLDDDGRVLWSLDSQLGDHNDGVAIVSLKEGAPPVVVCAASDEGLVVVDLKGNILRHEYLGHVQNPSIADFRPDLPGLEMVTVNFWGNQGIFHFFDAEGNLYHDMEPVNHGSLCLPVNWRGDGAEFFVLSANPERGGLYDGLGRHAVRFPADGHPDMCHAVLDLTGDCRDEIVVWDPYEIWVYTQDDNPKTGRLYKPSRNPLFNESNYRASVSLPGWTETPAHTPVDTSAFMDSVSHWRKQFGRDRNDPLFDPAQIVEIAGNLLRYQNPDGGWPKDIDWLADIPQEDVERLRGNAVARSTFDNHSTFPQIEYLARVSLQTGDPAHRAAVERGLDFVLREQRPTGGWRGADVDAITFNDGVMTGVMGLLMDIRSGASHFAWIDDARRRAASEALDRAVDCVLACQITVNGRKTAWCQQHDHVTFAPVKARTYELPSITAGESTDVLRLLTALPDPDARVIAAVEAGAAWLQSVRIKGLRVEKVPIEPVRFTHYTATSDTVAVSDPAAPPLWARYYDLETEKPFLCRRDGTRVETLAEVDPERRSGYGWYGRWPAPFLEKDYPAWRKRLGLPEIPQ